MLEIRRTNNVVGTKAQFIRAKTTNTPLFAALPPLLNTMLDFIHSFLRFSNPDLVSSNTKKKERLYSDLEKSCCKSVRFSNQPSLWAPFSAFATAAAIQLPLPTLVELVWLVKLKERERERERARARHIVEALYRNGC